MIKNRKIKNKRKLEFNNIKLIQIKERKDGKKSLHRLYLNVRMGFYLSYQQKPHLYIKEILLLIMPITTQFIYNIHIYILCRSLRNVSDLQRILYMLSQF